MAKVSERSVASVFTKPLQVLTIRFMYIALLIAFLVIGYLLGQLQAVNGSGFVVKNTAESTNTAAAGTDAAAGTPQEPIVADVDNGHLPIKGDPNAPVTMVEFSDFQCPYCGQFYSQTEGQIIKDYVDTGKVKIYYRHLPLSFHPQARPAALASECANEQNKFWDYHDVLFDNNATIDQATSDKYIEWATKLGMDEAQFRSCLTTEKYAKNVDGDSTAAAAAQASGTPTFYINGQQLVGAQPFGSFKAIIDAELDKS